MSGDYDFDAVEEVEVEDAAPTSFRRALSRKLSRKVGDDAAPRKAGRGRASKPGLMEMMGGRSPSMKADPKTRDPAPNKPKGAKPRKSKVLKPDSEEGGGMGGRARSVKPDPEEAGGMGGRGHSMRPRMRQSDKTGGTVKGGKSRKAGDEKPGGKSKSVKAPALGDVKMGSRSRSIRGGLSRTLTKEGRGDPRLASTKTGALTMAAKGRTLEQYPGLGLEALTGDNFARNLVLQGANSIRAEVLDLATMSLIMEESYKVLTHSALDRFFDWLPLFAIYVERYFFVEEDVLFQWVIEKEGPLRGKLKAGSRMKVRGSILKFCNDLIEVQDMFPRSMPAGERIGKVTSIVEEVAEATSEYFRVLTAELPKLITKHYDRSQCDKLRSKWVRHVAEHVGTEDFLVLYTRWMPGRELREWKTKVLLRTEFKFMTYHTWEKDMEFAHFKLVGEFAEELHKETKEENDFDPAKHRELMRQQSAAMQQRYPQGAVDDDELEYSGEFVEEEILGDLQDGGLMTMVAEEEYDVECV